ncbi:unnamed protein product, partial [Brassica rapa]
MGDVWTWIISFLILITLVGFIVYQLICLADLEFDYINPYDSATRINFVVLPEFFLQGFLCFFYLVTGHWFMSLLGVPYLYYNFQLYSKRQHLVDVTEIFNLLDWEKKKRLFKLAYMILTLFLTIFWLESLDLSRNQLSGNIPQELATLSFLEDINMSHNKLTGMIPQCTQLGGQNKSSFEGNISLCGLPLQDSIFRDK